MSGNYSWLNWLTVVMGVSAFERSGSFIHPAADAPPMVARPLAFDCCPDLLAVVTVLLSIQPALNLMTPHQAMNLNYNSLHLVGAYGAFGNWPRAIRDRD